MNKKFFTIGMAVLLGVSLSFLGCEDKAEEATEPTPAEKAATALAESADFKGKATADGATVTLTGDVTINTDISVADGVTVDVATKTLKVETGKKLTIEGTVTVKSGGTLVSPAINTETGLPTEDGGEIAFSGTGKAVLESGANGYYGTSLFISSGEEGYYKWGTGTSKVTLTHRKTTLEGTATVIANTGVAAETTITIGATSTLTIANEVIILIGGTLDGVAGATLVVTGTIQGGDNFYPNNSETAGNATTGTTYKWTADAGGTGKAGWKAEAETA